jgi:putative transposase
MKERFTEEIAYALAREPKDQTIAEIYRSLDVVEQMFYRRKKRFDSMGFAEVRQLKQLEEGNAKPKRLVADLSFEIAILQEMLRRIV